jgi:5-methylcytosine-specific restriction endonuclease McrA
MRVKICREAGCNTLIDNNSVYCEKHIKPKLAPFAGAIRSNEVLYKTAEWRKLRKELLKEQPYCSKCGISIKDAQLELHHIIPPRGNFELFFNRENILIICKNCHKTITAAEIRSRKR